MIANEFGDNNDKEYIDKEKMMKFLKLILKFSWFLFPMCGCYSTTNLWLSENQGQKYLIKSSFTTSIAASRTVYPSSYARISLIDTVSKGVIVREEKGFSQFDSHLVVSGGLDSVIEYMRQYKSSCGDSYSSYTYKLILTKDAHGFDADKSLFIHYGCEYGVEWTKIDTVIQTDSSLILHAHNSNESKMYPLWIEVLDSGISK